MKLFKNTGFFLLTISILLSIIAIFVVTLKNYLWMQNKILSNTLVSNKNLYIIEDIANKLINFFDPKCFLDSYDANIAIANLRLGLGCVALNATKDFKYYKQDLGVFPCMLMKEDNHYLATQHELLTVFNNKNSAILQIRIAKPTRKPHKLCESNTHIINNNILSSRYMLSTSAALAN